MRDLPGFVWDEERQRYFALQSEPVARSLQQPHLGSHAPENRHAGGGRRDNRRGGRGGRGRNRGGEAGSSGRNGGGADPSQSRGGGSSGGGDQGNRGERKRRGDDRLKLRKKVKSKQRREGAPTPESAAHAPPGRDPRGGGPVSSQKPPHHGGGGVRAVVRARECGLPVRCRGGDRVARGGASSEILAESLRCHARTLTLLGTIDVARCTGFDRVASFVRVDESFDGDTDNPPVHKGSEQFLMVGTNGNGTMGEDTRDRARIVTVRRGIGVGRHRGWGASDTTLRMSSVATGNLVNGDAASNPTVNAAVAPEYLARPWHQRRAQALGGDDQLRPTVFLFGYMQGPVFTLNSYRAAPQTMETQYMELWGVFPESVMPRAEEASMFDFAVSPHTGRVIAATDAGARVVFDETYFARGEAPPARLSVKGRSDITAVAADVDWWSESSGTVGNRPETFMLGMRNGGMTLFDTRETRMMRQPFAKASSYVTHLHAMRTSPGHVVVSTADGDLSRWDVRSLRTPVVTYREGSSGNIFDINRRCGMDARELFVGADCGRVEPPRPGHPRSGRDIEGVGLWDVRVGGPPVWQYAREVPRGSGSSFNAVHVDVGCVSDPRGWEYEDGPSVRVYAAGGSTVRCFVPTVCLGEYGHASLAVEEAYGRAPDPRMA